MTYNGIITNLIKINLSFIVLLCLTRFGFCSVLRDEAHENVGNSTHPVISINPGLIRGLERHATGGKRFFSFKGIPYAEPPVKNLRFRDPVPAKPWKDIKDALEDGNYCPQNNVIMGDLIGEEDCLYLNVYTPDLPTNIKSKKYPVLVNLHSGGFTMGSGSEEEFNPEVFVENDIVVVSINYRLGIFGFLSLDIPEVPGNAAFKDQRLCLIWVKDNIHFFNGDPNNVTLLGISAGSTSVEYQLLHPESKGLFHKASMQSGPSLSSWSRPRNPASALEKMTDYLGILNEPYEILNYLKDLSTMDVLDAAIKGDDINMHRKGLLFTQFVPVIEKSFPGVESFITEDPLQLYKEGKFVKVPTLRSFCRDEGTVFQFMYGDLVDEISKRQYADFMSFLNVTDKTEVNNKLTELYTSANLSSSDQIHEFLSDLMFLSGIYQSTKYITKNNDFNQYSYMFSFVGDTNLDGNVLGKVPHTIDMSYLVFADGRTMSKRDMKMRRFMSNAFVSFIKHGDPTKNGSISWQPSNEDNKYSILNIEEGAIQMIPFPFEDRMKYWSTLYH